MSAGAAAQQWLDADDVAFLDVVHAGAHCRDDAANLVTRRSQRGGLEVASVPVQVGAADTGVDDLYPDLALGGRTGRIFEDAQC